MSTPTPRHRFAYCAFLFMFGLLMAGGIGWISDVHLYTNAAGMCAFGGCVGGLILAYMYLLFTM